MLAEKINPKDNNAGVIVAISDLNVKVLLESDDIKINVFYILILKVKKDLLKL